VASISTSLSQPSLGRSHGALRWGIGYRYLCSLYLSTPRSAVNIASRFYAPLRYCNDHRNVQWQAATGPNHYGCVRSAFLHTAMIISTNSFQHLSFCFSSNCFDQFYRQVGFGSNRIVWGLWCDPECPVIVFLYQIEYYLSCLLSLPLSRLDYDCFFTKIWFSILETLTSAQPEMVWHSTSS